MFCSDRCRYAAARKAREGRIREDAGADALAALAAFRTAHDDYNPNHSQGNR